MPAPTLPGPAPKSCQLLSLHGLSYTPFSLVTVHIQLTSAQPSFFHQCCEAYEIIKFFVVRVFLRLQCTGKRDRSGRYDCSTWLLLVRMRVNTDSSASSNISVMAFQCCINQIAGTGVAETHPLAHAPLQSLSPTAMAHSTMI